MATVRPEFWVDLRGKKYPTWPGVLIALHEEGLLGIEVLVVQYPAEENGWTAVCQATVTMKGDGQREQVYTDVGDCNGKNASPEIAKAAIRMASTRAKGRAGRDAIALGATLFEELPAWDLEKEAGQDVQPRPATNAAPGAPAANGPSAMAAPRRPVLATRTPEIEAARSGAGWEGPSTVCSYHDCGRALAHNTEIMSLQKYKRPLCLDHMKALTAKQAA
jgi:hypothetical protein